MRTSALTAFILICAVSALAQGPVVPKFSSEVEMVNLSVSVTDHASGQYIADLEQSDFIVYENGHKQSIAIFERQTLPIDLVLLIDGSASMTPSMAKTQEAAIGFARTLRPEDSAQVVVFSEHVSVLQDWTSNIALLEKSIRTIVPTSMTQLYNGLYIALQNLKRKDLGQPRRKVIIVLTDGYDTASTLTEDQVLESAGTSGAIIYAIALPPARESIGTEEREKERQTKYFLYTLCHSTGGTAWLLNGTLDLKGAYELIAQELRMQYRIGYYPAHPRDPGPRRTISVTVRHANVVVKHRTSYRVGAHR